MGNAAAKELKAMELSDACLILKNESMSITSTLVTKATTKAEAKGKKWLTSNGDFLWATKQVGMIKSHSLIKDKDDNTFATVIVEKMGLNSVINFVCKPSPTFEGQDPLTADELKKAGIEEGTILYKFSKLDTVRKMTTATSAYSIVTGKDDDGALTYETLYTGEKLSAMGFLAIIKEGDIAVAKAKTSGMTMIPKVEVSAGVDILAVDLMGYSLSGGENAAGAMAGACVI